MSETQEPYVFNTSWLDEWAKGMQAAADEWAKSPTGQLMAQAARYREQERLAAEHDNNHAANREAAAKRRKRGIKSSMQVL